MKVRAVKSIGGGMSHSEAERLWSNIETFGSYGFNKSHSVEYTLISFQSMFLKTYYPREFYASALSLFPEEKLGPILREAEKIGIEVLPPDINRSTEYFEILDDGNILIPFPRVKGLTTKTAEAIKTAREQGEFASKADFVSRVEKRRCNSAAVDKLDRIGAFANIEQGQPSARDPSRVRDQIEFMPGLVNATVTIDRSLKRDKATKLDLANEIANIAVIADGEDHALPVLGRKARFMVVTDAPNKGELRQGRLASGNGFERIEQALRANGLVRADAYWTSLIKVEKGGTKVTQDQLRLWLPTFWKEIDLLDPPVIVLLGSQVMRQFFPDLKGKPYDASGRVHYLSDVDRNVVTGFSPGECYFEPDKIETLIEIFRIADQLTM